jgi:hypothetical protein
MPGPLLDKLAALLFSIANFLDRKVLLVADAYYASGRLIIQLLANGHQLVTRAKGNAVAYLPVDLRPSLRRRGRPRIYGEKGPAQGSRPRRCRIHFRAQPRLW